MPVTVDTFDPEAGVPGQRITVFGSGFNASGGTRVWFFTDKEGRNVNVNSDEELTVTVPDGAQTGIVKARNANGEGRSSQSFTVQNSPVSVTGFSPAQGQAATQVTIVGKGFSGGQSVSFGSVQSSQVRWNSDTSIVASVPSGIPRNSSVQIQVTSAAGTGTSVTNFMVV